MPDKPRLFTQIEVEHLAEEAAKKAVRAYRKGALIAFVVLSLGVIGAFAVNAYDLHNRRAEFRTGYSQLVQGTKAAGTLNCNSIFTFGTGTRAVLLIAQSGAQQQYQAGLISKKQYKDIKTFYTISLAGLKLPDCRRVERLVSTDPRVKVPTVEPLYVKKVKPNATTR